MGFVSVKKTMGGEGLPELTPWSMEVRQPLRYENGYAYFDVSDLLNPAEEIFIMSVVAGIHDYVYGGTYMTFNPGKITPTNALPASWYATRVNRDKGKTSVSINTSSLPAAEVTNGELKVHMRPDDTKNGTYTAQGGFLLILR